jgi:phytoene/squalene synthetase
VSVGPLLVNLLANRRDPPLARLAALRDPERFVWHILPHAARTFALCITLLPRRLRLTLAVAYLYCRILDTYEDLLPGGEETRAALRHFCARFQEMEPPRPAQPVPESLAGDARHATHVLLVNRCALVDAVFCRLLPEHRAAVVRLVRRMGSGMAWSSGVLERQGGALRDVGQLSRYCWNVLGNPMLFAEEMQRLDRGLAPGAPPERLRICRAVGEAVQLANVTRDLEKDAGRGVYYHPDLRQGSPGPQDFREVRARLVLRALRLAPSFEAFIAEMPAGRVSRARGAAVVLAATTLAYYQRAAVRAGFWGEHPRLGVLSGISMWARSVWSRAAARRVLASLRQRFDEGFQRGAALARDPCVLDDTGFDVVEFFQRGEGEPEDGRQAAAGPVGENAMGGCR